MKKAKKPADCRWTMTVSRALFISGLMLILIAWGVSTNVTASNQAVLSGMMLTLMMIGVLVILAGVIYAWRKLRCPACGETLCLNGRIPMRLPETCPHCGHPLPPPRRGGRSAPAAKAEEPLPAAEQPRLDEAAEEEAAEETEPVQSGEEQNP